MNVTMRKFEDTATFNELTDDQRHALRTESFLLIKAIAGSGKTKQLVALVLKALMDAPPSDDGTNIGLSLDRFAVITFTRKAGAELRDRLRKAMEGEHSDATSDEERRFWKAHLSSLPAARVGTIDSLVQDLLRRLAIRGRNEIDPAFGVLDQIGTDELTERAILRVLEQAEHGSNQELCHAISELQKQHDRASIERRVEQFFVNDGDGKRAREAIERLLVSEQNCQDVADNLLHPERDRWRREWLRSGPSVAPRLKIASGELKGRNNQAVTSLQDLAATWRFDPDQLRPSFREIRETIFTQGGTPKKQGFSGKAGPYSPELDALQEDLQSLVRDFDQIPDTTRLAEWEDREQYRAWGVFLEAVEFAFESLCRDENRYPFHMLGRLLDRSLRGLDSDGLKELGLPFARVLVDEFQDNTTIQWHLACRLAGGRPEAPETWDRITVVGDPEQSIYHWRTSNPQLMALVRGQYLASKPALRPTWYDNLLKAGFAAPGKERFSIPDEQAGLGCLSFNWRTTESTLCFIDCASSIAMTAVQAEHTPLKPGPQRSPDNNAEVILLKPVSNDDSANAEATLDEEEEETDQYDARSLEMLARELVRLNRDQGIPFREMIVLSHSFKPLLAPLQAELEKAGVPYRSLVRSEIWRRQEVRDIVSLVRCLADPGDGLALFAVLRGPCCRLTDSEILLLARLGNGRLLSGMALVAAHGKSETDIVTALVERPSDAISDAVQAFALLGEARRNLLGKVCTSLCEKGTWRAGVDRMPHHQLIRHILASSGAWQAFAGWLAAAGTSPVTVDRISRGLEYALDRIEALEAERPLTMLRLAHVLEDHVDGKVDEVVEAELAPGEQLVRLMTAHASKGLEARVVALLVPEVPKRKPSESVPMVLLDRQYFSPCAAETLVAAAVGLPLFKLPNLDREDNEQLKSIFDVATRSYRYHHHQELARLFHVALTRCKSVLVVAGVPKPNPDDPRHWPQVWVERAKMPVATQVRELVQQAPPIAPGDDLPPDPMRIQETRDHVPISVTTLQFIQGEKDAGKRARFLDFARRALQAYPGGVREGKEEPDENLGPAIGRVVHRALQMGKALPADPRSRFGLLEAMAIPILDGAEGNGDGLSLVRRRSLARAAAQQANEVLTRLNTPSGKELKKLLKAPGQPEVDFAMIVGEWIIKGRFDRLLDDGAIVDWKTDHGTPDDIRETYAGQMKLYALARHQCQPTAPEPITVHLALTSSCQVVKLVYERPEIIQYRSEIEAMLGKGAGPALSRS